MVTAADVDRIAWVCHEANRAWCDANGDTSQLPYLDAPDWQRESAQLGVRAALKGATPEQSHEGWTRHKLEQGWTFGAIKDPELKTHPCLVPYDQLPEEQRLKDVLFTSIVRALGRRGDGEGGAARAGACESDVPQGRDAWVDDIPVRPGRMEHDPGGDPEDVVG